MSEDLRVLVIAVRRMVNHHPFDHDLIVDEKRCAECKALKAFDVAFEVSEEDGAW